MQIDFILLKFPPFSFKQFSLNLVYNWNIKANKQEKR